MTNKWNIILLITDGHGYFTGDMDWGTKEFYGLKQRLDRLNLVEKGYAKFSNVVSPAVSTIMSIESIMSGIFAAKTHKLHWRQWPQWDRFDHPVLSEFLKQYGYEVNGFSYLLNSENWLPCICCYKPQLYKNYPSVKRDTHSHEAVLVAVKDYFANAFKKGGNHFFIVHTIFVHDIWNELMDQFSKNGITEDNTIFAFTADHYFPENFGRQWLLGERDNSGIFHHTDLTEHNTRVPLYLKYPGSKGLEINDIISGYDIAPTLIDLLGLFSKWPAKFDGVSLVPLLKGQSIPPRMIRTDNLYPFQIGEKQGRITAVRNGRYKYVFRPDPPSSYIAYRLNKNWSVVLNHEEFYDLEVDLLEEQNLIHEKSKDIQEEIAKCREFLRKTNEEIIAFHVEISKKVFQANNLAEKLFQGKKAGDLLCIQSSEDIVFDMIVNLLVRKLPGWGIDIVIKKSHSGDLSGVREKFVYPHNGIYQEGEFFDVINSEVRGHYDCIINTSNAPMGDYLKVYDDKYYPVGDFDASKKIIRHLNSDIKASLCLDMTYKRIHRHKVMDDISFIKLFSPKNLMKVFIGGLLRKFGPRLRKFRKSLCEQSPKINKHFSERIIASENESKCPNR